MTTKLLGIEYTTDIQYQLLIHSWYLAPQKCVSTNMKCIQYCCSYLYISITGTFPISHWLVGV